MLVVDLDAGDIMSVGGGEESAPPDLVVGNPHGSSGAAKKLDQARKTGMKFIAKKLEKFTPVSLGPTPAPFIQPH